MFGLAITAALAATCPFAADRWKEIPWKRDLPPGVLAELGEMAEKGEPFQVSDALPPGPHPPFSRFVSARGRGCDLTVKYEHGGIAHSWRTATLRLVDQGWVVFSR